MSKVNFDYAVISNNQNPAYKDLFPYIQKRWNQLGIKTLYVDYDDFYDSQRSDYGEFYEDKFGNITIHVDGWQFEWDSIQDKPITMIAHVVISKWFPMMISRFLICTFERFKDKKLIISDGDLMPINVMSLYSPSCKVPDVISEIEKGNLVTTAIYPDGRSLATYTYGLGSTFQKVFEPLKNWNSFQYPFISFTDIVIKAMDHAGSFARKYGHMYLTDEDYMNYLYSGSNVNLIQCKNRKWIEMGQDINNLYPFQIDLLRDWTDLCPFIELHNMRAVVGDDDQECIMTDERWTKLFSLLEVFDKYHITPNNWFYESIQNPWRDTIITKDGRLIHGDEWEETKRIY